MLSRKGELLYVGKAKCLRARLLSYFRPKSRDAKAGRIVGQTASLVWEYVPSEFAALLRELELIRRWRPRWNVQGQPGRRRPTYVCLGRPPAPYAFLARQPPAAALSFGPIPGGRRALEATRCLNDFFRLRDCSQTQEMIFAEQAELFPIARTAGCLRYEISTCMGPCLGACTRSQYMERVQAARSFLTGSDLSLLDTLEHKMAEASTALAFERAAALRDKWRELSWLNERLEHMRSATARSACVYPVDGYGGANLWYLIQGGRVIASMPVPKGTEEKEAALQWMAHRFRQKKTGTVTMPPGELDSVLLVAAWFRRHPREQARLFAAGEVAVEGCIS